MSPNRFERIQRLFEQVCELSPGERAAFLERECGSDKKLRGEIEDLLAAAENSQGLFANVSNAFEVMGDPGESSPQVFQVGETLAGRFQIVRYIGRGGMGEVYEASDSELGENVAIKTLRPEFIADPVGLRRFKREIQIARRVAHRNVCTVFDIARHRTSGPEYTFLSMELLQGETLGSYLKRHGKIDVDAAVPLVRQMAAGLDALHREGIVHRDFKPGNVILVGGETGSYRVVVTDFGLARSVVAHGDGETEVSRPGELLGTLDYMAPEQFSTVTAGPPADIYAFGLVLYRMLAGHHAYEGADAIQIGVRKATQPPKPIQEYVPRLDGRWIEAIGRCLERDPGRRFESAGEAVRVIEGLPPATLPVEIKPSKSDSVVSGNGSERLERPQPLWKRIGVATGTILLMGCLLVGAIAPASVVTLLEKVGLGFYPPLPDEIRLVVMPVAADAGTQLSREYLDGLTEAVASRAVGMEPLRENFVVVPSSEVLREARRATERIENPADDRDPPDDEGDSFAVMDVAGKLGANVVLLTEVAERDGRVYRRAELVDPSTGKPFDREEFELRLGDRSTAEDQLVSSLAGMLDLDPAAVRATQRLETQRPDSGEAYAFYLQGRGYLARHDKIENVEEAIQLFHRSLGEDSEYALAYAGLGEAYWRKYAIQRDGPWMNQALQNATNALEHGEELPQVHTTLGLVHLNTGRTDEATADFLRALDLDSRNVDALIGLGQSYEQAGARDLAEATFQKAIALRPNLWTSYKQLGLFYHRQGRYEDAIEQYNRILDLAPDSAHAHVNLGAFSYFLADYEVAEQHWRRALDLDPGRPSIYTNLGKVLFDQEKYDDALQYFQEALDRHRTHSALSNIADAYRKVGREEDAVAAYNESINLLLEAVRINPSAAAAYGYLAHNYAELRQEGQAIDAARRALSRSPNDPELKATVALAYASLEMEQEATQLVEELLADGYPRERLLRNGLLRRVAANLSRD